MYIYIHIYKYIITYLHIYIHTYFCFFLTNINQYTHIYIFTHYIYIYILWQRACNCIFVSSDVFRSCSIKEHTNIHICLTMFTQFLFVCVVLFVCMLISHMIIIKISKIIAHYVDIKISNLYMYVCDNIQSSVIFSNIVSTIIIY